MTTDRQPPTDALVSAAEVARLAGVTRAAVSNWRRRHPDFPTSIGEGRNAVYRLSEINDWLDRQRKRGDVANDVLVWQALRGEYRDEMVRGLADLAELFTVDGSVSPLGNDLRATARALTSDRSPGEAIEGLCERLAGSSTAGLSSPPMTTSGRLVRAILAFAGPVRGVVLDPACGIGSLLLAAARHPEATALVGQEVSPAAVRLVRARAALAGGPGNDPGNAPDLRVRVEAGDSLTDDRWPQLKADLVVCDPPTVIVDWGRERLLFDSRWELGVPTKAEQELAWLQHCYAHVAPGGRAIVVMSPSAAYRRAGRRIRAELVRRGILHQVVALPPGMVTTHAQPVHLWILRRPTAPEAAPSTVALVDLTGDDPDGPLEPSGSQRVEIPLIDLLDDTVDLTPARHVAAARTDHLAEYLTARQTLRAQITALLDLLPPLDGGASGPPAPTVRVADLIRAGLVDLVDGQPTSTSDQLDTDFLQGFLRSGPNVARSTSGSGTYRSDPRGSRIPQMGTAEQRTYGAAFRALEEFDRRLAAMGRLGELATGLARDGLTSGTLRPPR